MFLWGLGTKVASFASAAITELSWSSSSTVFASEATAVASDSRGNVITCGYWQEQSTLASASRLHPFVSKYSSAGLEQWRLESWGTALYGGECAAVDVDESMGVYVAINAPPGVTISGSGGDFYVFKLDGLSGKVLWRRIFDSIDQFDEATSIRVDLGGAVYVGGFSQPAARKATSNIDGFVLKLDATTGNTTWISSISSSNNGDDRVFGVNADSLSGSVFVAGDTTGVFTTSANEQESPPRHGGDLFLHRLNAQSGQVEWIQTIGHNATSEVCQLSSATISGTSINPETITRQRGNCGVTVSPGATHLFVVGTAIGGALSTYEAEQQDYRRVCASAAASATCTNAILARVDSQSGHIKWVRQLVSRASSSGERAVIVPSSKLGNFDVVMVALTDAGFQRADAMEQLAVLRLEGSNGETMWVRDVGDAGPDRAIALAGPFPSTQKEEFVLALRAGTRRRGDTNNVTTTLTKLSSRDGTSEVFCRDAITFGTNQTAVVRPVAQILVVALPVYLVGSVRCTGSTLSSVSYATIDGTAAADIDFIESSGAVQLTPVTAVRSQPQIAEVAIQILPVSTPDSRAPIMFTVRLKASSETTKLVEPFEVQVSIEPSALLDHVQATVRDGSFWQQLTRWTTAAMSGAMLLVLFLRVCCSQRLAWAHRQRLAFEYKALRLHDEDHESDSTSEDGQPARTRSGRWWRWRRDSASRGKPQRPSSSAVGSVGVAQKPPDTGTNASHQEQLGGVEDLEEEELRSHLTSIQTLNASLDQLLAASESADSEAVAHCQLGSSQRRSSPRQSDRPHRVSSKHRGLRLALRLSAPKGGKTTK